LGLDDLDGDGIRDLIVGAPYYGVWSGYVNVYSGANFSLLKKQYGPIDNSLFGASVGQAGDLDGDGVADYMVGAPGAGADNGHVYAYSGQGHGLIWHATGPEAGSQFGSSLAGVDDFDGDGVEDVLVGAPGYDEGPLLDAGAAFLLSGQDGSVLRPLIGTTAYGLFGSSVAFAGDLDGDGEGELAVGEPQASPGGLADAGRVHLYSGATGAPAFQCAGQTVLDLLGASLGAAGDVNADGTPDLIAGARGSTSGGLAGSGSAFLFSGTQLPLHADPLIVPAATGGQVTLTLNAGPGSAGRWYLILGSTSGISPGLDLGSILVPLNYDAFTAAELSLVNTPMFANFLGVLDGQGGATATFDVSQPIGGAHVGRQVYFAAVLLAPEDFATNPTPIEIMP
jgi:hypothetical protein